MSRRLFLILLLIDSLFGCALAAGAIAYRGTVHPVAVVAVGVVLAAFAAGAGLCLWLAWTGKRGVQLKDIARIADDLPALAIMGTALGFLIALPGDPSQIQHRISGAASGLLATVCGVACWVVLGAQHWLLARRDET